MVIDFEHAERHIHLKRQFLNIAKKLEQTRLQLESPLSTKKRKEVRRQRKKAIRERDRLEHAFDFHGVVKESGEIQEIQDREGTNLKNHLFRRLPLEDLG